MTGKEFELASEHCDRIEELLSPQYLQKRKKEKDEYNKLKVTKHEEKLRNEMFLSPKEYPGLLAEFSLNPPRNPQNPP